ncbi:tumor necrosis factor receptor superfamily member 1B isoform X2 [Danio aesculapii]|uniref:tumor necrosis factor receptor superfamily member 1B isoform X2 n=1 Tax=Danio aesculapii TaxID=1142201 RepID=UPI0024BFD32D|nr:tumor necrosis factor receptor superfamily member 1B isoform X2 [Danio aesculapii]
MLILIARLLLLFMTVVWLMAEGKAPPPYRPEGKLCNNATSEYYMKKLGLCCSKCKPGTRLTVACSISSDTICEPCAGGLYSESMNHYPNCFKCPTCKEEKGLMYGTNCSADTKAVCVCKPGMYCSKYGLSSECEECKKHKSCKPGEGAERKGSPTTDVKCAPCPIGTFSDRSGSEPCRPHTQCEGSAVLRVGNSTDDTVCKMKPLEGTSKVHMQTSSKPKPTGTPEMWPMNTDSTSTVTVLSSDVKHSRAATTNTQETPRNPQPDYMIIICITGAVVLVLLILVMTVVTCKIRERKGLTKVPITDTNTVEQDPSQSSTPDHQHLLHVDRTQTEPSMSSSDSQSQPDCSQSHSSSEWLERSSQDECPSVSSPVLNLSITATFNCQLNPAAASCSIPINPSTLMPHAEAPVPLSQEEVCISTCQQEDGKEALQSVQESGPFLY